MPVSTAKVNQEHPFLLSQIYVAGGVALPLQRNEAALREILISANGG